MAKKAIAGRITGFQCRRCEMVYHIGDSPLIYLAGSNLKTHRCPVCGTPKPITIDAYQCATCGDLWDELDLARCCCA